MKLFPYDASDTLYILFSPLLALFGIAVWTALMGLALTVAGSEE